MINMKIGLYNLEPKIVNAAMMKVSSYHKGKGDEVEEYNHLLRGSYDKVYAFSMGMEIKSGTFDKI